MKTNQNQIENTNRLLASPDEQFSTATNAGSNSKPQRGSVYDQITEKIVAMLESGTVPWHKPWKSKTGWPRNLVSGKTYRGINVFLLASMYYESPFWLTFRQCKRRSKSAAGSCV